ncbi:MAG: SPOR domain-containing protein, partial [Candidatus Omnitrophica bacterium]|nr:SPOR domain-containing protein [Candidatus Omnitrophota bacterium]
FTERKNALSLSEELIAKGYDSSIVEDEQGAYFLYKVRIGRYNSRYEAQKISSQLSNDGYPAKIYP